MSEHHNRIHRLSMHIKSLTDSIVKISKKVSPTEIEQWGCQSYADKIGIYQINNTQTVKCARQFEMNVTFFGVTRKVGLDCSSYKNRDSCQLDMDVENIQKFKECCGGDEFMHRVVQPISCRDRVKYEADDIATYEKHNLTDTAYACGNHDGLQYDLTPICGQITNSSSCWASSDGRSWYYLKDNLMEWEGVQWRVSYVFTRCCILRNYWEKKMVSEVPPRNIVTT